MGSFSDSIKKNVERVLSEIDTECYDRAADLFLTVVRESPSQIPMGEINTEQAVHSKGLFINNWMGASDSYNLSTTSVTNELGIDSRNQVVSLKELKTFFGKDGFVSFSNNLSYAQQVENYGWYRTGPYAPVQNAMTIVSVKYK